MPIKTLKYQAAFKVAVIYLLFAFLWIIVSDEVLLYLIDDKATLSFFQTIKGWFFVSASGLIIYTLLIREFRKLEEAMRKTQMAEEKYGKVLQSATNGIIIAKSNHIVYTNPYSLELLGMTEVETANLRLDAVIKNIDDNDFYFLKSLNIFKLKGFTTAKLLSKNGIERYVEINTSTISINDSDALLMFFSDISELVTTQAEFLKQKSFFEQTFMQSGNAMAIFAKDGSLINVNSSFAKVFRMKPTEFDTLNILEIDFDNETDLSGKIPEVFAEGGTFNCNTQVDLSLVVTGKRPIKNSDKIFSWKMYPILDVNNAVDKVILNVEEITLRVLSERNVQKAMSMLRAIVENIPHGAVYLFDKDIRFIIADGSALREAGWNKNLIEGRTLREIKDVQLIDLLENKYREVFKGIASTFEISINGIIYEVNTHPVTNDKGEIYLGLATALNVTARKKQEIEIQNLNCSLEVKIAERTAQLESTNVSLQQEIEERMTIEEELLLAQENLQNSLEKERDINRLRTNFVSMVMHEYRTPLTVIQTSSYLINEFYKDHNDQQVEKHLGRIHNTVQKMTIMLDELLYLGKSAESKLNISQFDFLELIKEIAEDYSMSNKRVVNIELSESVNELIILSDQDRIQRIFQNLIGNAIKYSEDDVIVLVKTHEDYFEVEVNDKGIGIPEKDKEGLFKPFHRCSNVNPQTKGTGLGLAIVEKAVTDIGGKISFVSAVGKGTTFLLTLPKVSIDTKL